MARETGTQLYCLGKVPFYPCHSLSPAQRTSHLGLDDSPPGSISDPGLGLDSLPLSQAFRDPYPSLLLAAITLSYNDYNSGSLSAFLDKLSIWFALSPWYSAHCLAQSSYSNIFLENE